MTEALLITGTMGVGKTVTAVQVGEQLQGKGIGCAVIDLDWLCWLCAPATEGAIAELLAENLAAVIPGFVSAGASRFVLARAVRTDADLDPIREGIGDIPLSVVRLDADPAVIAQRLAARHTGDELAAHLAESAEFSEALDSVDGIRAAVVTDGMDPAGSAAAVLAAVGW